MKGRRGRNSPFDSLFNFNLTLVVYLTSITKRFIYERVGERVSGDGVPYGLYYFCTLLRNV